MKLQPAVKKTVRLLTLGCAICLVAMLAVFGVLHLLAWVVFDYTVILGGVVGTGVAVLNFVLMCLTVQAAAQIEDKKRMKGKLQLSYNARMILQAGWVVAAFMLPWFQPVAAAVPLLFPSAVVIVLRRSGALVEPSQRKNEDTPAQERSE